MTDTLDSPMLISRRGLIKGAAGALALFTIDMSPLRRAGSALAAPDLVNGWIQINADNTVTVAFCAGELGQGIMTGLAQWAAEELMVDWSQVRAELVPPGRSLAVSGNAEIGYGTGGSKGMVNRYENMRRAGLEARLKLEQASGGTAVGAGMVQVGEVTKPYSEFAAAAKAIDVSSMVPASSKPATFPAPFVQPDAFKIVGQGTDVVRRLDIPDKVNGKAKYGLDVRIPGMVYAVVKNCPTWSGTLAPTKVPAAPAGTSKVVPLKPWVAIDSALGLGTAMALGPAFNAVAVVASNTWIAKKAAMALSVSWTIPTSASKMTTTTMLTEAKSLITSTTLTKVGTATTPPQLLTAESTGNAATAFAASPVKVDQYYQLPNIPHVMMEVPNATVRVNANGTAECWVSTQGPLNARVAVAKVLGIPTANVTVYPQLCGGGLGRRIDTDVIAQAAQVAKALPVGTPVMLVWPREEDLAHDQPRPAVYARAMLGYDPATPGMLTSFGVRNVSQSPSFQRNPFKSTNGVRTPSPDNVEGAKNSAYKRAVANILVEHVLQNSDPMTSAPTGYWRSVGASTMCFVVESAMDELAVAAGVDPFTLRRNLLASSSDPHDVRMVAVMDSAKSMIEAQPLPAGSARGYAISEAFGSKAAVAVEVTKKAADGTLQVKRVALAVDPGFVVNPDQVRAQMEGGIIHGISSALWGQLTWSSGKANTTNFSNQRVLRMAETPAMQIDVRSGGALTDIGGTGEVPVPLMAPAMANAWFALTASRVRTMPFYPGAKMSG